MKIKFYTVTYKNNLELNNTLLTFMSSGISEHEYEVAEKKSKAKSAIINNLFQLSNVDLVILARELIFADMMLAEKLSDVIRNELQDNDLSGVTE